MKYEAILGRLFIAILSLILALILVDYLSIGLLSTRSPIEQRFPVEVFRKPAPYTMFQGTPYAEFQVENEQGEITVEQLNGLGYRGQEPLLPKPAGEYRVFMLGGSTVFLGEPPIPALLEEEFKRNGLPHVKVYNFGVISSVSGMELARIAFEIPDLRPDLIIMYNGGNDIMGAYRQDPRPGYPFNFLVYESNPLLESDIKSYPTLALLAYGSNLARYFFPDYFLSQFSTFNQLRDEVNYNSDSWRTQIAQTYVNNLVKADKISRAFGADFIAFAQPILYFKEPLAPEEADLGGNQERRDYVWDVRQRIRSAIEESEINTQVKIIDLSDIYNHNAAWVFTDAIHTRQESKPLIAQTMYNDIMTYFGAKIANVPAGGS